MIKRQFLKWGEVLIVIQKLPEDKSYGQKLCKEINCASSHVRNIIPWLEKQGLIRIQSGAKIKKIILTKKGKTVVADILKLRTDLGN